MANYVKIALSGLTDGQGIDVTGVNGAGGNIIHTAVTGAADSWDEVWLYAYNQATAPRIISVVWGTTAAGSRFRHRITGGPGGLVLISPGLALRNAKVVKAYVTIASAVAIFGYVNRVAT